MVKVSAGAVFGVSPLLQRRGICTQFKRPVDLGGRTRGENLQTLVVEVTRTSVVIKIMALLLRFVQLFLEMDFVARQHIVTGTSLITYRSLYDSGLSVIWVYD